MRAWYAFVMSKTLVDSWLAAELASGKTKSEAMRALNKACDTAYTLSRIGDWVNGKLAVPVKARPYMLRVALAYVLEDEGISANALTTAKIKRIAERLS
jgi:hypothetical protein